MTLPYLCPKSFLKERLIMCIHPEILLKPGVVHVLNVAKLVQIYFLDQHLLLEQILAARYYQRSSHQSSR